MERKNGERRKENEWKKREVRGKEERREGSE